MTPEPGARGGAPAGPRPAPAGSTSGGATARATLVYDAGCGLCQRTVRWLAARDRRGALRFVALGSPEGERELRAAGLDPGAVDSVVLVAGGRARTHSSAVIAALRLLGAPWSLAVVTLVLPRAPRDALYRLVARHRHAWFGRACILLLAMRLFIAVFPPPDVQQAAYRAADPLRIGHDAVAWVRRENLHYTMRFLGEVDDLAAERAKHAMREAAAKRQRFGAALGGFGAFPTAKRARVLWIGMVQGAEPMRLLASELDAALARHGFEPADQAFEPHLTLGRVRAAGDWTARLIDAPSVEARFQVDRLVLVKSVLAPGGSRYEPVAEAMLG